MKFTLGKQERLKSRKLIEKLYKEGNSVKAFPLRMVYLQTEHTSDFPAQVGVSVAKRNFKKAPDRNRLKRLMRETYRLQKEIVYDNLEKPYVFMISYIGKEEKSYDELFSKMNKLLYLFIEEAKNKENEKS
ncbi:ribonuclease P protein component [Polaribacter reichenbachii]|uniref:Ribonuclease P protein component n=1 Tax=Polaribacter reichenbachii TaxID=996801 RepID=A0A1B8TV95_9FLAO|nr:ribonuclease P protein component [Polaribacter reichenbachii]APZ45341.1 ribonuclease P protein component [Polaribacter reichenbachii]AUC19202.1 ribonuclease P protein component [Polaribacter reichenbachii]OBY63641.1 ribonuclease P protein component [Polaribacter reichenbachii]